MPEDKPEIEQPIASALSADFPGKFITPIFSNQFYIVVGPGTSRLTLGEFAFLGQDPTWSSAVVMPTDVAIDLAQKILQLAKSQGFLKEEGTAENGSST